MARPRRAPKAQVHATIRLTILVDGAPWVAGLYATERSARRTRTDAATGLVRELVDVDMAYHGPSERDWAAHGAPRLPAAGAVRVETNLAPRGQPPRWRAVHTVEFAGVPALAAGAAAPPPAWEATRWFQLGDARDRYVLSAQCVLRAPDARHRDPRSGEQHVYELKRLCVSTPGAASPAAALLAL